MNIHTYIQTTCMYWVSCIGECIKSPWIVEYIGRQTSKVTSLCLPTSLLRHISSRIASFLFLASLFVIKIAKIMHDFKIRLPWTNSIWSAVKRINSATQHSSVVYVDNSWCLATFHAIQGCPENYAFALSQVYEWGCDILLWEICISLSSSGRWANEGTGSEISMKSYEQTWQVLNMHVFARRLPLCNMRELTVSATFAPVWYHPRLVPRVHEMWHVSVSGV